MASGSIQTADEALPILPENSMFTDVENTEQIGLRAEEAEGEFENTNPKKKIKLDKQESEGVPANERKKGVAPIKAEYLLYQDARPGSSRRGVEGDDAAEASGERYSARDNRDKGRDKKKQKGQNKARDFGNSRDKIQLCNSRALAPEFSPAPCAFGDKCRLEHDLRKYLREGKREDLTTFNGICPLWDSRGECSLGWKCRFVGCHSEERETQDGRKELILMEDLERKAKAQKNPNVDTEVGVVNVVPKQAKIDLAKRKTQTPKSDAYIKYLDQIFEAQKTNRTKPSKFNDFSEENSALVAKRSDMEKDGIEIQDALDERNGSAVEPEPEANGDKDVTLDNRAQYIEPPFLPSEKRRIYYGPETPVLAPLTTQGNLPFRRLCVELGAQVTWSEMAMGMQLIQGHKPEWALMKAHESETRAPRFEGKGNVVKGYDNTNDMKFGAQIAANKPWLATKSVEILTSLCPNFRAVDLNCGCPIDLVCRQGSGSALLDNAGRLENMLRGMNAVSNETPITAKIRMGTKDAQPTAEKLIKRLVLGSYEAIEAGKGTSGVAAITLHGRSKQQRYTKNANWEYIAECSALIRRLKYSQDEKKDTAKETDSRNQANEGDVYFVGNGDCYSHVDYYDHLEHASVDSVMVARGALIKPWIFEEIEKGQYLDKSASERLSYVEKFAKYGLQTWGSDEMGVGTTRKFLLEWLSFACRYVPIGLLDHLPPKIQDRPPAYKGRNELETLMSSENYRDWIKISEMFLGPAHPDFKFQPKHKSNAYEMEAEG